MVDEISSNKLSIDDKKLFLQMVVKSLFVFNHANPDLQMAMASLKTRVRILKRMIKNFIQHNEASRGTCIMTIEITASSYDHEH